MLYEFLTQHLPVFCKDIAFKTELTLGKFEMEVLGSPLIQSPGCLFKNENKT